MVYSFKTQDVCSRTISFDIDAQGNLHNIRFDGGCPGNTAGVTLLAEGRPAAQVAEMLAGVDCRGRGTSCPAQFAKAINLALEQREKLI